MSYRDVVMADAPSAYASFENTQADAVSGTWAAHTGTMAYGAGRIGQGFAGNGATRLYSPIQFTSQAASIECWYKSPRNTATLEAIMHVTTGTTTNVAGSYLIQAEYDGYLRFLAGGTTAGRDTLVNVRDNNWHHIVITWNGTTPTVYLDGVAYPKSAYATSLNGCFLWVGGNRTNTTQFIGTGAFIDEVAVYNNKVLSAARVLAHYEYGMATIFSGKEPVEQVAGTSPVGTIRRGQTVIPLSKTLAVDSPMTIYGRGERRGQTSIGLVRATDNFTTPRSILLLQESSGTVGQAVAGFASGDGSLGYSRTNGVVTTAPVVLAAVRDTATTGLLHTPGGILAVPSPLPTSWQGVLTTHLRMTTTVSDQWDVAYLFEGAHSESTRRNVMNWLEAGGGQVALQYKGWGIELP